MVAGRPILEVTGRREFSSRVARDSTLIERQPAVRLPVGCITRSRLSARATSSVRAPVPLRSRTPKRSPSPPICEAGASSSCSAVANISALSKRRIARELRFVAAKQFALDNDPAAPAPDPTAAVKSEREAPLRVHSQRGIARQAGGSVEFPPSTRRTRPSCHSPNRCRFASRL
jgi:hypothetical protein